MSDLIDHKDHLFGDKGDFAIEVGWDALASGTLWCHMRAWAAGEQIGDIKDTHNATYTMHRLLVDRVELIDELWNDEFGCRSDIEIFDFLDDKLYGFHRNVEIVDNRSDDEVAADAARFSKYGFLTNWSPSFDGWKSFLIAPPGQSLRVLHRGPDDEIRVSAVKRNGFINAVNNFDEWHKQQLSLLPHRG